MAVYYLRTARFAGLGVAAFFTGDGPGAAARFTGLEGPGFTDFFTGEGPTTGPETALVLITNKPNEKIKINFLNI